MMTLITGGSKCGKSRLAETIVCSASLPRFYIATMIPFGAEADAAIERHRRMREGKSFITIEQYTDIGAVTLPQGCAALVECMGNLCANEMFERHADDPVSHILIGIDRLRAQCELLVIVTNQVGADGVTYSAETMDYIRNLGDINAALAQRSDCVIEAVCGIPFYWKGEALPCLSSNPFSRRS